ncbi:hypothetical protein ABPG74_009750 [Tetrahymena malaccensis]
MNNKYYQQSHQQFEIQAILDKRANPKNGKIEYLVQWKQWPLDYTWEPKKNIQSFIDQNELFVDDEDLRRHYKEKQYRRKILREEREDQIEKICNSIVNHSQVNATNSKQNEDALQSSNINDFEDNIIYEDSFSESDFQEKQKESQSTNKNLQYPTIKKYEFEQQFDKNEMKKIQLKNEDSQQKRENSFMDEEKQMFQNFSSEVLLSQNDISQKAYLVNEYLVNQNNFKNEEFSQENLFESKSDSTEQIQFSNNNDRQKQQNITSKISNEFQSVTREEEIGDFMKDQISNIEMEIKYSFKVKWEKRSDGVIPLAKTIEIQSKKHITPQEMIDYLNQQYQINNYSNRNTKFQ